MPYTRNGLGLPDVFGAHIASVSDYQGPASYPAGGDPVPVATLLGAGRRAHFIAGTVTVDGLYEVNFKPSGTGPSLNWFAIWEYLSGQGVDGISIATAGTGQTNGTYTINGVGGGGTGAQASITIAGGVITAVSILNPGSGYTSAPTFTVAEGGTPGTLTATIGSIAGVQVANGTNLSASYAKVFALGE